jgi:hypothetical protein
VSTTISTRSPFTAGAYSVHLTDIMGDSPRIEHG